jgi:hypothetical protein
MDRLSIPSPVEVETRTRSRTMRPQLPTSLLTLSGDKGNLMLAQQHFRQYKATLLDIEEWLKAVAVPVVQLHHSHSS